MTTPLDPAGQSAGTGTQSGTDSTGTTTSATTGTGAQSGAATDQTAGTPTVTRAEFETLQNQLRAADQKRTQAEKEAETLRTAALSETERAAKELTDTKAANEQLQAQNKDLQIKVAFVSDNTHDWHDANAALKLADLSGVTIDADGTVKGLKEALEAVAKSAPYLLKPKAEAGAAGATGSEGAGAGSTGTGVTGVAGTGGTGAGTDKNALARKFPQLAGRVSTGSS